MFDEDEEECLPISRRSLVDRYQNTISSDNETSPSDRRQSRLSFNNSISIDESIPTPKQLIALYEKTLELAAKNKINIKNAFHISLVERLPEVLNLIAFDDSTHSDPNFFKVGSIIDTSAKIYGFRVDALHTETQKLSGSIQPQEENLEPTKPIKKPTQYYKSKSNSYITSDLSTISISYEFQFHPLQPSNMCKWPGGIGSDSIYADMVSYTMYSSSDFPLINGFVDLNSRINMEYIENDNILDLTTKTIFDLIPLREVIKDNEGENHILGCQILREFTFNEEATESYIETIDECSMMDSLNDDDDEQNILSDLRDEPMSFDFQELQSTYTGPVTMPSMDMTVMQNKISFVDHVPYLLREKTEPSDYSYFDAIKLKLFAGPYVWKYTNLFSDIIKPSSPIHTNRSRIPNRHSHKSTRNFRINLLTHQSTRSINELMALNRSSKSILKKRTRTTLSSVSHHTHQLRRTRKLRPLAELILSNNFPDLIFDHHQEFLTNNSNDDPIHDDNYIPEDTHHPQEYDFVRPIHYDKIEFDKSITKIDTKKLQYELSKSSAFPISFSNLCVNLIEKNLLSIDKSELISAFYCMLNNCNKKNLFMKTNLQQDDLIIQKQPFQNSIPLSYSHRMF